MATYSRLLLVLTILIFISAVKSYENRKRNAIKEFKKLSAEKETTLLKSLPKLSFGFASAVREKEDLELGKIDPDLVSLLQRKVLNENMKRGK